MQKEHCLPAGQRGRPHLGLSLSVVLPEGAGSGPPQHTTKKGLRRRVRFPNKATSSDVVIFHLRLSGAPFAWERQSGPGRPGTDRSLSPSIFLVDQTPHRLASFFHFAHIRSKTAFLQAINRGRLLEITTPTLSLPLPPPTPPLSRAAAEGRPPCAMCVALRIPFTPGASWVRRQTIGSQVQTVRFSVSLGGPTGLRVTVN